VPFVTASEFLPVIVLDGEHTEIRPLRRVASPFLKVGVLGRFRSGREINAWLDSLRKDERNS
jgi:hypothetical protein